MATLETLRFENTYARLPEEFFVRQAISPLAGAHMLAYIASKGALIGMARTLAVLGDAWSLLVLREMFLGAHRFDQLQQHLGIARNVLAARLRRLIENGILTKRRYAEHPERFE